MKMTQEELAVCISDEFPISTYDAQMIVKMIMEKLNSDPVSTDWGKLEKDFYEWKEEYMLYATEPPTPHYLFEWFKKKLGSQQHQDSIVPCVAQVDSSNSIGQKPTPPAWYTRDGMFEFLRNRNYCVEIANELADTWASILQGAFKKGWEKGYNDFNPEKGTFDYTYASKETVQALLTSPASKKDIEVYVYWPYAVLKERGDEDFIHHSNGDWYKKVTLSSLLDNEK